MSFENIQLPDFLLADLYKDCLVELDTIKAPEVSKATKPAPKTVQIEEVVTTTAIRYLGENQKQITVVVNDGDSAFINPDCLQFLTNVLTACKLNLGDIAILNVHSQPTSFSDIVAELTPAQVMLFDVEPTAIKLPFTIPDFQPLNYAGVQYLKAPALKSINQPTEEGKMLKTRLWRNLQQMFPVSK